MELDEAYKDAQRQRKLAHNKVMSANKHITSFENQAVRVVDIINIDEFRCSHVNKIDELKKQRDCASKQFDEADKRVQQLASELKAAGYVYAMNYYLREHEWVQQAVIDEQRWAFKCLECVVSKDTLSEMKYMLHCRPSAYAYLEYNEISYACKEMEYKLRMRAPIADLARTTTIAAPQPHIIKILGFNIRVD